MPREMQKGARTVLRFSPSARFAEITEDRTLE